MLILGCHLPSRINRQRPIYKFSQVSRFNSRTQASLRFNEPGYATTFNKTQIEFRQQMSQVVVQATDRWRLCFLGIKPAARKGRRLVDSGHRISHSSITANGIEAFLLSPQDSVVVTKMQEPRDGNFVLR